WLTWRETLLVVGVFFLLHVFVYQYLVWYRERHYLRTHIIGLVIDGVIADIVPAFCSAFEQLHGRNIRPDTITRIPVNECSELEIKESEEHGVFHSTEFWRQMPVIERAARRVKDLKNVLGFKI